MGGAPRIGLSAFCPVSKRGIALNSPAVYGCSGLANSERVSVYSTIVPPYITATVCAICAITPRSCVMSIIAE